MADFDIPSLNGLPQQAAEAGAALAALQEPAERAASAIDDAFAKAGSSLARSLGRAAADGKITLGELAEGVLRAVNAAAGVRTGGGLAGGLGDLLGAVVKTAFAGARADGGPVSRGQAYLVGERGPEVFRPSSGGEVSPAAGGMTVNVNVQGEGATGLLRSEAQIAQALARAVSLGGR